MKRRTSKKVANRTLVRTRTVKTTRRSPKALEPKDYRNYIRSTAWKKKKKYYWGRCKDKSCRGCGKEWEKGFNLHHATYIRLGIEKMADLMPLCHSCHRDLHAYQNANHLTVEDATKQFIRRGKNERNFRRSIPTFEFD
jgi:hypothetical protein